MHRRQLFKKAGLAAVAVAAVAQRRLAAAPSNAVSLDAILRPRLTQHNLPALAAAAVVNGQIVAAGAVGTRRAGADIPVTLDDKFHIGSCTKAMTALLAGIFVEGGKLRWDTTVAEVYPELTGAMRDEVKSVRLDQLLSHTSGIPADNDAFEKLVIQSLAQREINLDELRYWVIGQVVALPPQSPPGERFAYSNLGYMLAGGIIERITDKTWEELVATRIFDPLGLNSAGFGPQSSLGRVDAPLGHLIRPDGTLKPMLAGPNGDNPIILGPAGTVHLSILELARWAGWNAGQGRHGAPLVSAATLRKLQEPVTDMPNAPDVEPDTPSARYGLGWNTGTLPFAPEPIVGHNGSNGMNLASVMLVPGSDFAMVMTTNVFSPAADDGLRAIAAELYQRFAPK